MKSYKVTVSGEGHKDKVEVIEITLPASNKSEAGDKALNISGAKTIINIKETL